MNFTFGEKFANFNELYNVCQSFRFAPKKTFWKFMTDYAISLLIPNVSFAYLNAMKF